MADWTPTGTDADLGTILRDEYACTRAWEAWQVGTMTVDDFTPMAETEIVGDLLAWRDAAVARHLAEAGAVHPAVHTPNRVMRWLGEHGWERAGGADIAIAWDRFPRRVYVPVNANAVDYGRRVSESLRDAAYVHDVTLSQVLLEIALLPDEVAW